MEAINIFNFRNRQCTGYSAAYVGQVYSSKGAIVKKLNLLATLGFVAAATVSMAAQDTANRQEAFPAQHAKTIRISGKVSDDGTRFVQDKKQRVWFVSNLETLKGYEGQQVELRGRAAADTNLIQVLSIRGQVTYTANQRDSAFRR